jgi:hypothetical protein
MQVSSQEITLLARPVKVLETSDFDYEGSPVSEGIAPAFVQGDPSPHP